MIIGTDVAGVVGAVGEGVTHFSLGDQVYAEVLMRGACAERVTIPEDEAACMPSGLTFLEAAAVPVAGSRRSARSETTADCSRARRC